MSGEIVKLKGSRTGLQLVLAADTAFEEIRDDIQRKLEEGSQFFRRGTVIQLAPGILSEEDEGVLKKLFRRHGVLFRIEAPEKNAPEKGAEKPPDGGAENDADGRQKMLVLNRTVRGGQEIRTHGSVLICGNVNPGAQIIAGGSVDIRGICRGMVHAGAYGDASAFIVADRLEPVQIRIADRIAQAPEQTASPAVAERASIQNGQIVIEPIERQEGRA